jgi:hypothetical protein
LFSPTGLVKKKARKMVISVNITAMEKGDGSTFLNIFSIDRVIDMP